MPWPSMDVRYAWARRHPLAGSFAVSIWVMLCFAVLAAVQGQLGWWFAPAAAAGIAAGTIGGFFAARRRWGERPDADEQPLPTRRRIWVRSSDRALKWWGILGLAGGFFSVIDLVRGQRVVSAAVGVLAGVWLVVTTRSERSRRMREEFQSP